MSVFMVVRMPDDVQYVDVLYYKAEQQYNISEY